MLKSKAGFAKLLAILFIGTPLFIGCNDEPATIGLEILPSDDLFEANMQIESPVVMNVWTDGIQSDGPTENTNGILGYFNDPRFGITKADFVTEFSLVTPRKAFKENNNFGVDSVVLSLSYFPVTFTSTINRTPVFSWYGDSTAVHHVKIYELNERLTPTGKYYSNTPMEGRYFPEVIGEKIWKINDNKKDSIWNINNYVNTVKIYLSEAFGNKLLNLSSKDLAHRDSLKDAINGLYITLDDPANPQLFNSLLRLNLLAATSNLTLYYHEKIYDAVTNEYYGKENFSYTFPINRESRMFNRFTHDHGNKIEFESPSTPFLHVQSMSGSYVKVDFSDKILAWKETLEKMDQSGQDQYGISSVELVFEADTFTKEHAALYAPKLTELLIYQKDESGKMVIPRYTDSYDNTVSAFVRTSATYNSLTNQFVFKMRPDYFVKVAKGEIQAAPFYLRGSSPEFRVNRIVLINTAFPEQKPKLHIKYVKYK